MDLLYLFFIPEKPCLAWSFQWYSGEPLTHNPNTIVSRDVFGFVYYWLLFLAFFVRPYSFALYSGVLIGACV